MTALELVELADGRAGWGTTLGGGVVCLSLIVLRWLEAESIDAGAVDRRAASVPNGVRRTDPNRRSA